MSNLIGQSLGRYHILEQLGEGGMATVYKAYDTRLERDVAIKVIRTDQFAPAVLERILKRFEREAKALARLTHPNIVHINDYGEHDSVPYLVMDYLPGGTLKGRMGKPMPWQDAVRLLIPIANALDYAHEQKVIHRDVKPANILLTQKGLPMLSDFGIAKILETENGQTLTGTGMGVGTPEYMSPEQGMGREVDARADIYSLGIIFFELITGRKPYTADTPMAVILKHTTDPLPRPRQFIPNLPEAVERVLLKALAKNPKDRYPDAGAFATALENLTGGNQSRTTARAMDDSSETMDTFATNLQSAPESGMRQKAPIRRTPAPAISKGMVLGLGVLALIVVAVWIGSLLWTSVVSPAVTQAPEFMISDKDGMTLLYVPAGEFTMGSDTGNDNEQPIHKVNLDAFWIDRTEVTNKQYAACVSGGGCAPPEDTSSTTRTSYYGNSQFDDYPVINVDWDKANTYCSWAGRRLPTEAEWEKAARGSSTSSGDERIYPWGNAAPNGTLLNYNGMIGDTTKVGNYKTGKSIYGAYDMAGNVWEWVNDWYSATYYQSSPSSNPLGPNSGDERVLRGGSWLSNDNNVRSAYRNWIIPSYSINYFGFRCSRSLPVP